MLKIDIITIFPGMFTGPFDLSIVKRAQEKGLVEIKVHDLRKWTEDKRGTVDDRPYGGGAGMVMKVKPIAEAIGELKVKSEKLKVKVILTSPRGRVWNQNTAREYSKLDHIIIVCGHYEGVDERVNEFIDNEVSIGDYVLTGGEIPAMVMVDSIVRLIPGVLIKENATIDESFSSISTKSQAPRFDREARRAKNKQITNNKIQITNTKLLEYPQYTHPENYKGLKVPPVLLSGNHKEIEKWRKEMSKDKTAVVRPDLLPTISGLSR